MDLSGKDWDSMNLRDECIRIANERGLAWTEEERIGIAMKVALEAAMALPSEMGACGYIARDRIAALIASLGPDADANADKDKHDAD